jgi:hypothetical protein
VSTEADVWDALEALEEEVESEDDLLDLVDNLTGLASALRAHFLPKEKAKRADPLDKILRKVGKSLKNESLQKLSNKVRSLLRNIRKHAYGGWDEDDTDELVGNAIDLKDEVSEAIKDIVPVPTDDDD